MKLEQMFLGFWVEGRPVFECQVCGAWITDTFAEKHREMHGPRYAEPVEFKK